MAKQFAVMSESTRITEIHEQDRSLRLLVWVVGAGVFLFGVITVVSVLLDSTDRKRGTIGILRVMGVSRPGVFYLVVFRAAAIGLLAGFATFVAGFALAHVIGWKPDSAMWYLSWKPVIKIDVSTQDAIIVVLGALGCSCFGAIIPAWRASRLDPFDAIVEGRFR
jgi:ABC-type antimicrobial peptide transport system permease subunit